MNKNLLSATFNGDLKEALNLIKSGADVNTKNPLDERTPLFNAVECGSVEIVSALLSTRLVDHEIWDRQDRTPLDRAHALRALAKDDETRSRYDKITTMINAYDVPSPSMAPSYK